ncbi:unnamed protein product [Didymodactylos carnosus]|uniref:Ufm1-specific protease 2 n=1 Tax=Didymodactylos carnosus TaxID=1234261 RepID=A0A814CVF2_9BILA|nr:unnamed protein product [Didymodactylos carnosus]CAF1151582.1 unnamed protein product [Didymodactylos carnosus]CAF3723498.1 unnamed protein product [Didymodactylos carnosus]CAF3959316.1 unnamed protein product [Didymodactylos carnosus]
MRKEILRDDSCCIASKTLQDDSVIIRILCQTQLILSSPDNNENLKANDLLTNIINELNNFRVVISDSGYHLDEFNLFFTQDGLYNEDGKHALDDIKIEDLLIEETTTTTTKQTKHIQQNTELYRKLYPWKIIKGKMLKMTTEDESCYSPVIQLCTGSSTTILPIVVDVILVCDRTNTFSEIRNRLEQNILKQMDYIETYLEHNIENIKLFNTATLKPYHCYIKSLNQILTIISDNTQPNDDIKQVSLRKQIHEQYNLPYDRPLISKLNAIDFDLEQTNGTRLFNVHKNLPSKVQGGKQTLVIGNYAYYHYMQDGIDDNQWGCAYRSLQTLASWFQLQGYTEKKPPTHKQIQQTLIDIEDKPKKFLNSRQWIGSMEVSYVLQNYLNIECKIITVDQGANMSEHVREIIHHFETEGTPIMIGGGVLAHTILGVDFNEMTGDCCLLILDPHYTSVDDIKIIQDKGWVGWKGWTFWDQNAFYNLCCPLRPKTF